MAVYGEKKHWWVRNKKMVDKYMKEARNLIVSKDPKDVKSGLRLVESVLCVSPGYEVALELKARSLLILGRFKDVADMLQDYIPSLKLANSLQEDSCSLKCFDLNKEKKKVSKKEWRYLVLGQACCHLGLMEDALVLIQTGKRLATDAFRRQSICLSDDSFFIFDDADASSYSQLLSHIKLLLRRRTAALAALDAGLFSESIRHFSKILDSRRGAPKGFVAECFMHRASAYRSAGRIAESIADCNKTLALEPSCLQALETRAALFDSLRCFPDSLHDLEHLKLLYNSILRHPGPVWKRHNIRFTEIPGKLCVLTSKIQLLKHKIATGDIGNVDYHALMGINPDCSRSDLDRAFLLLNLKHKPDRSLSFIDRFQLTEDEDEFDSVKDRARMSTLLLYRLIHKGYSVLTTNTETYAQS